MSINKLKELAELVKQMRDAQKTYFVTRGNLAVCKQLEREVDKAVEAVLAEPRLFREEAK